MTDDEAREAAWRAILPLTADAADAGNEVALCTKDGFWCAWDAAIEHERGKREASPPEASSPEP